MNRPRITATPLLEIALVFCASGCGSSLNAQDTALVVRATIDPEDTVLVGQRVTLSIDVLAEDLWASLPSVPEVEVPGALVYQPSSQSTRLSEQIDGGSYTGQRYELWIFPQREGKLQLPSLRLVAQIKPLGIGPPPTTQKATTDPISIDVRNPKGVTALAGVICVSKYTAAQSWFPESTSLQVGGGITRTITRTIDGAPGMLLVPPNYASIDGVSIYPKQPSVEDATNRGELTGKRADQVTYMFEKPGKFEIPALELSWYDVSSERLRTEKLDGRTFDVSALDMIAGNENPEVAPSETGDASSRWSKLSIVVAILTAGIPIFWFRKTLLAFFESWSFHIASSEQAYFRQFVIAAKTNNPGETLRALMRWWDAADKDSIAPRLDLFVHAFGDPPTRQQLETLELAIDRSEQQWQPGDFVDRMRQARRRWIAACDEKKRVSESCLPPLNPAEGDGLESSD